MTRTELVQAYMEDQEEDTLVADGHDHALQGITLSNPQEGPRLVYDYHKVLDGLGADGMNYEEALEFAEFNILDAWAGAATPLFMVPLEAIEREYGVERSYEKPDLWRMEVAAEREALGAWWQRHFGAGS